jgi:hypothetical protein
VFGISAFAQSTFAGLGTNAFVVSITEDSSLADSSTQLSAFLQSQTEDIIVAEVENDVGVNYFGSATEVIGVDDLSTQLSTFLQIIAEDFNPADTPIITAQFAAVQTEDQTIDDSSVQFFAALGDRTEPIITVLDANTQQTAFVQDIAENNNLADTPSVLAQFASSITENMALADIQNIAAQFAASVTENQTLEDSPIAGLVILFTIIENLNPADSSTQASAFLQTIAENLNSADSSVQQSAFLQSLVESFGVLDLAGASGWFKINNDQTITWTAVNNSSTVTWTPIDNTQR